jgi:Alpha/beta hydrolase domain
VLVPAVNTDGNETAGVAMPLVWAPLATYTGWNVRAEHSPGVMAGLAGSTIPFPRTSAERRATGDPRSSIEERYPADGDHEQAIPEAARGLRDEGFLLDEDAERFFTGGEDL